LEPLDEEPTEEPTAEPTEEPTTLEPTEPPTEPLTELQTKPPIVANDQITVIAETELSLTGVVVDDSITSDVSLFRSVVAVVRESIISVMVGADDVEIISINGYDAPLLVLRRELQEEDTADVVFNIIVVKECDGLCSSEDEEAIADTLVEASEELAVATSSDTFVEALITAVEADETLSSAAVFENVGVESYTAFTQDEVDSFVADAEVGKVGDELDVNNGGKNVLSPDDSAASLVRISRVTLALMVLAAVTMM